MFSNSRHVGIVGGTFTDYTVQHQHHHSQSVSIQSSKKSAIDRLMEASSLGALHNSGERFDPPKCHPNTRTAVLKKLMDWFIGKAGWDKFVLWLYGPAGVGKSAIAQTFAELCYATDDLLASFFFSRSDPKRNNAKSLVATLAYQVSLCIPGFWNILEAVIERDPAVFQLNFESQFQTLILGPLLQLSNTGLYESDTLLPKLFIIDGIDECQGSDVQRIILNTISNAIQQHRFTLPFKFLIASQPEYHLFSLFCDPSMNDLTLRLALDDSYQPDADIKIYLIDSFRNIRKTHVMRAHLPDSWPSEDSIAELVAKASGQFIYAATVIRYVSSPRHNPLDRLKVIQGLLPVNNDKPYAQLDALYISILSGVEDIEATLRILGVCLILNELNPSDAFLVLHKHTPVDDLERFMLLSPGNIQLLLLDLPSVVDASDNREPIKFLHASFTDFLFDHSRSLQFYISPNQMHGEAARLCIRHINLFWRSDVISRAENQLCALDASLLYLVDHLEHAGPLNHDANLREEVLNISYVQSFKVLNNRHSKLFHDNDVYVGTILAKFLDFLKTSDFWDTQELYLYHRGVWDEMMRQDLALVPENRGLAFWTVYMVKATHRLTRSIDRDTITALPSSSETPEALLYVPLSFFTGETQPHALTFDGLRYHTASRRDVGWFNIHPDYLEILTDFLSDPLRAGPYTIGDSTYIMAAEFVVAFAVRPWDEKKRRINRLGFYQWDLIWDAFISILSRAGKSKELVDVLCRANLTFALGRPDQNIQESLRSMFQTVSDYLLKCMGFTPAGFQIIVDWTQWQPSPGDFSDDNTKMDRLFILDSSINA